MINFFLISCVLMQIPYELLQKTQQMPLGKNETISLTEADDGKEIKVTDGTLIQLTLPVNPTTGYAWELKDAPSATRVVVQHGEPDYVSEDPLSLKAGSGGHITYHFQALGLGKDTLVMELRRDKNVAQTITINIESIYPK